jgi:hypothetical protein
MHVPVDVAGGPYGVRSTTSPYGPPFRSVLAGAADSDYGDSGLGVGGSYDPTSGGVMPRTPSDFYRAASSSNDYAYIQETSTPPPLATGVSSSSFGPRRNFEPVPTSHGGTGSTALIDGNSDVAVACRAPYSTLERSDSSRSGHLQQQRPLLFSQSHFRGSNSSVPANSMLPAGVDAWNRHHRMIAGVSPLSVDERCFDQS